MSWVAVGVAAVSIGVSAYEYASAPGAPKPPNLTGASRAGTLADAQTLADRRALESASQQGIPLPGIDAETMTKHELDLEVARLAQEIQHVGSHNDQYGMLRQQHDMLADQLKHMANDGSVTVYKRNGVYVSPGEGTADFTGYGEADVQGQIAKENAQNMLDLQNKYGPQFIDEALKEEQLADPQGYAARQREYDLIKQQEAEKPERPVANLLDQQVSDQLSAGKGLDKVSDDVLRQAVGQAQASRGQSGGNAEQFAEPLTTGFEGEKRLSDAEQKALGWLSSGATPEDVQYRREQQNLANLSSFVNNRTPESQFGSLSGAQQGPAPFNQGTRLASGNPGAGPAAAGAALQGWNTSLTQAENTANPWMAGLSALLRGAGAVNTAMQPHP